VIIRQLVLSAIQKLITREQKINYTNGVQETEPAKKNSAVETEQATVFDIAVPEYRSVCKLCSALYFKQQKMGKNC
jgi:hypothetical protein